MKDHSQISRRAFTASLVVGIPTLVAGQSAFAQSSSTATPLIAVTPEDLHETLLEMPFEIRYQGFRFEPAVWEKFDESPYGPGVGGVDIRLADDSSDMVPFLGSYGIYKDDDAAEKAMLMGKQELEDRTRDVLPKTIEGYKGEVIVYQDDGEHTLTFIPVQNVLVIGYDTAFRGRHGGQGQGHHRGEHHGDFQSISHAAVLIKHLRKILDRQT